VPSPAGDGTVPAVEARGDFGALSGDGFVRVADGTVRWGLYGAAGLLVRHVDAATEVVSYFVALRSEHTHMGGTWAIPGGALTSSESPIEAAVREFREETGLALSPDRVVEIHEDDHGGWSYWTVVVDVEEQFPLPTDVNWETADVSWVAAHDLPTLPLLKPFHATMIRLGFLPE
jgi:8-oxo-dGTP diphosphatase